MGPSDAADSSLLQRTRSFARKAPSTLWRKYRALHPAGKLALVFLILFYVALGTFIIVVRPGRIAQYLYDLAQKIARYPYGWLILGAVIVIISFPPCIGHTTSLTICGFAYGMKGLWLGAGASILGSALVFVTLRFLFARRLRRWSSSNEKWVALEEVIRAKGLPLIILIRMSPFPPWVYSNTLFASIEPVKLWQFVVATFFVGPKMLLAVFIGSRAAALADGEQRNHMDKATKIINICFIIGGIVISIIASYTIYHQMQAHIRHISDIPSDIDELAAEAVEAASEGAPLLRSYTNDSSSSVSSDTIRAGQRPSKPSVRYDPESGNAQ
ncbi:Golgi apparatus membrane protein TVP38 [Punctularia strigosozonata HHB-11173 SS5]|uniref:Golgi apparatus membrane protein TVP38 n=1 Tax=Punctularia strigosozonata (strain HHB-11173) TaxID=741275 RepID=UPI0004417CFB|nr:Golgi apparatus membrane protein TVP38 [Punctularia strigosozonata HHB-11173 SS5]EIN10723.1 Golgi apparatus membrane protein TVP38 [Punctularia strigosozonata HHB-11173 SS5]